MKTLVTFIVVLTFFTAQIKCNPVEKEPENRQAIDDTVKFTQTEVGDTIFDENCDISYFIKRAIKVTCIAYNVEPCTKEKFVNLTKEGVIPKAISDSINFCPSIKEEIKYSNETKVQISAINHNDTVNKMNQTEITEKKLDTQCDNSTEMPYVIKLGLRAVCKTMNFDPCTKEKLTTLTNEGVFRKILLCSLDNEDFNEPIIKNNHISNVQNK